ncbi:odorant receptor 131-2-like [Clarias gariepinus]|uniref:odorant receptor 131-2-like n=1 Tax=Clarias gariepinus TaxID=13013 RepID=UPI00234D18AD|nr:odorant receptor 131-2-like [Clarias gariepinus]
MAVSNDSTAEVSLIYQQVFEVGLTEGPILKASFALIMSLFFTYLNAIMVYTLWSKPVFEETPRYILFNHMLLNDSIHLLVTSLLYVLGLAFLRLVKAACAFIVFISVSTFRNTPVNLAVMSLERYVAICFPLRHAEVATQKITYIAIGLVWLISSINLIIDLLYGVVMDSTFFTSKILCTRERLFIKKWQLDVFQVFNIFYFVSVTVFIVFTYISIVITARSLTSNKPSASKAHKTVLLHFIQLSMCLNTFLYSAIERAAAMAGSSDSNLFLDLRYLNYLFVLILPRCLSPLIYGLRDDAVRPLFIYYFCMTVRKIKTTVNIH